MPTSSALALLTLSGEYEKVPYVIITEMLGRYGEGNKLRFSLPAGTIDNTGQWMKDPDVVFKPTGGSQPYEPATQDASAVSTPPKYGHRQHFFEEILYLHDGTAIATMLGWWMSSLFRPVLMKRLGGHPLLNVYARPGAGKTSLLARAFWPAFTGVMQYEPLSCTSKDFVYARDMSSSNAIPIWVDEYKPSDMGTKFLDTLHRFVRRLYAGDTELRGTAWQGMNIYYIVVPLVISGETRYVTRSSRSGAVCVRRA